MSGNPDIIRAIETQSNEVIKDIMPSIVNIHKVRLGEKPLSYIFCEQAYKNNQVLVEQCNNCLQNINPENINPESILKCFPAKPQDSSQSTPDLDIPGIPLIQWQYLIQNNKEMLKHLSKTPNKAFAEGYIALRDGNSRYTQSVLLLKRSELTELQYIIEKIVSDKRNCDGLMTKELTVRVISAIMGELLQISLDTSRIIAEEKLQKWFGNIFDLPPDFNPANKQTSVEAIASNLCRNSGKWNKFLHALETIKERIDSLISEQRKNPKRIFTDTHGTPYFWIYPKEIYPFEETLNQ